MNHATPTQEFPTIKAMTTAASQAISTTKSRGDDAYAIDLQGVHKTYRGKVHALRGIDMRVGRGEVFGLLGPNGAGKSTLVKILMTVIRPSKQRGHLLGHPVGHKPTLARVGYLPEHHTFPGYLTGAQILDFYGAMAGVVRSDRKKRIGALLDMVGMTDWADKKVKGYSKGMRQRVGIAQSLMNDPALVLLDEPTDGVDPEGRRDIRGIMNRLRDEGRTVFINSHLLSELEAVCDRVAILVQGTVERQGTIDSLTQDQRRYEIELVGTEAPEVRQALSCDGNTLTTGESLEVERNVIRIGTDDPVVVQPLVDAVRAAGLTIRSLRPVRPSLEDLFMEAVRDKQTGEVLKPGAAPNVKNHKRGGRTS